MSERKPHKVTLAVPKFRSSGTVDGVAWVTTKENLTESEVILLNHVMEEVAAEYNATRWSNSGYRPIEVSNIFKLTEAMCGHKHPELDVRCELEAHSKFDQHKFTLNWLTE